MNFLGYIRFKKATGITEAIENEIKTLENGGNAQEFKINFRYSLDNNEILTRIHLPFQGTDLTTQLDNINVDEYEIFGNTEYSEENKMSEFKNSCQLALTYLHNNTADYEAPLI